MFTMATGDGGSLCATCLDVCCFTGCRNSFITSSSENLTCFCWSADARRAKCFPVTVTDEVFVESAVFGLDGFKEYGKKDKSFIARPLSCVRICFYHHFQQYFSCALLMVEGQLVKPVLALTCFKRSHFSCRVIDNFI